MLKPAVYLDTNIISAYWYEGSDVMSLARRIRTRDWWESERSRFRVWVSATSFNELKAGKYPRQADCVKMASRIPRLPINKATRDAANELLQSGTFPAEKDKLAETCRALKLRVPLIVSPESIPQVRFGQEIRRST